MKRDTILLHWVGLLVPHVQRQLGLAHQVFTHERLGLHLGHTKPLVYLLERHLQHLRNKASYRSVSAPAREGTDGAEGREGRAYQRVSRDNRFPELAPVDPSEEEILLRVVRVHHRDAPNLRKRLHNENPRHDRALREVAGEEIVVDGDIFQAYGHLTLLVAHDSVDEQERIPRRMQSVALHSANIRL